MYGMGIAVIFKSPNRVEEKFKIRGSIGPVLQAYRKWQA
jgi:hypothetical protein